MNDIISRTGIDEALAGGRILVLDGAMGTMLQRLNLGEEDFSRGLPSGSGRGLKGDNECLNLTRPDVIRRIHDEYIAAGADIIETNTFGANSVAQAEYGLGGMAFSMALEGARIRARRPMRPSAARGGACLWPGAWGLRRSRCRSRRASTTRRNALCRSTRWPRRTTDRCAD